MQTIFAVLQSPAEPIRNLRNRRKLALCRQLTLALYVIILIKPTEITFSIITEN